ncbi:hypothetical protein GCM10007386_57560 [Pseudoduganella dura]|nr:hypothetical protein GCM10007386_57560 [Pseudoduganella dura]
MICGSVWTCPTCAAKISERRKLEIQRATTAFKAAGGALYMLTFTFSHSRHDDLAGLLGRFSKARTYMREQRAFKELKEEMGFVGDMRALEITYGDANGWHPHEHDLWLTTTPLTRVKSRKLVATLFELWVKACAKAGLALPNRKRGVDLKEMDSADEYLAKFGRESTWGTAAELTKQHIKKGKAGRSTSFDLLRMYEAGDKRAGQLFIQFASAFFGKQQIRWSKGLKAMFGVQEITDEELAKEEAEDSAIVTEIRGDEWAAVLHQPYDVRSAILDVAETGGADAVRLYLDRLVAVEVQRRRTAANSGTRTAVAPGF